MMAVKAKTYSKIIVYEISVQIVLTEPNNENKDCQLLASCGPLVILSKIHSPMVVDIKLPLYVRSVLLQLCAYYIIPGVRERCEEERNSYAKKHLFYSRIDL
jgi:hypothetical protein